MGPYRLGDELGSGGFGTVYRAVDSRDGRRVAIKLLHPDLAINPEAVRRFEREILAVRRIRHANVIEILDVGTVDGVPYFAMELLSGTTLRSRLRDGGRLSPEKALDVLRPIADALAAAHRAGVVHRDLKASNVFLDRSRVVLLDFGVAKLVDDDGPKLTSSRIAVGSPACMAPEQILGKPVDARTDVYGLGVLAYHVLTGKLPFVHSQATIVQEMHLVQPPPPVSRRTPVGPDIDAVIGRAMSKNPLDRQADAAAFLRELEEAVSGPKPRGAIGLTLAVHVESASFDALDELTQALSGHGLEIAFEAGNAVTLIGPLAGEAAFHRRQRRRVIEAVESAVARLGGAEISVYLNLGLPEAMLRLGAWVPETGGGVLCAPAVLEGLGRAGAAVPGSPLLRLSSGEERT
jgi:serine/threonine-protein kinase